MRVRRRGRSEDQSNCALRTWPPHNAWRLIRKGNVTRTYFCPDWELNSQAMRWTGIMDWRLQLTQPGVDWRPIIGTARMRFILTAFLALLGLLLEFGPAMAADDAPVQGPMLRIEAGMHTGIIMRVDLSADGKLMVTGSSDKTVRLWSLPDGKLLRTLRVPISPDNGGKVNAVAI